MAITANKLLGKGDKGGELVVIPKATLVKYNVESSGELTTKPEKPQEDVVYTCLLYTSPSPRDRTRSRMPSSA